MKAVVLLQSTTEEEILKGLNEKATLNQPERFSTSNNLLQLLGLVILLIIILFAAYYTSRLIGRMKMGQMKNSNFHTIDTYRIAPGKTLQIVKIGKKYVVISIAKDNINLITELAETDLEFQAQVPADRKSFRQIIDSIRNLKE